MKRIDFLREEHEGVSRALREALRHDYGPDRSKEFYGECESRIASIGHVLASGRDLSARDIADQLKALASVGSRVALLERSRLGEFSWPFAYAIVDIAERLFSNEEATGPEKPIVHVVAEGIGYHIWDDELDQDFRRRIMVVAFPRHLKHHVLLHSIFGHELGHPALKSDVTMSVLFDAVIPIMCRGPLQDAIQLKAWMQRDGAPGQVRRRVDDDFAFTTDQMRDWRFELLCDLFGLVLFGPAFAAAHRMILEPLTAPEDYSVESSTHPPYPLRKRLIADAMKSLGWLDPVVTDDGPARQAEAAMLSYAGGNPPSDWHSLIEADDLAEILGLLSEIFGELPGIAFARPQPATVAGLLDRLAMCRPPTLQSLDEEDAPLNERIPIQHCLYAGWAFWFGREALQAPYLARRPDLPKLDFLQVNRLCEQALLQQRAVDAILDAPK